MGPGGQEAQGELNGTSVLIAAMVVAVLAMVVSVAALGLMFWVIVRSR